MTKRRDVVKFLIRNGFWSKGGTKHEKFTNGRVTVLLKRHREIEDEVFEKIKIQAGLK
ncbi:MAG: type II toxin-antitoxin system HicA family toxin [Eggerthellaceae bacterium]|nr:type II toxin-antitoxin system HicA family toxin [Eggerthellaceae bacterium]